MLILTATSTQSRPSRPQIKVLAVDAERQRPPLERITNKDSALTGIKDLQTPVRETSRKRMYRLRGAARHLVSRSGDAGGKPRYRVAWCGHRVKKDDWGDQHVEIRMEDGRAFYHGLVRCGDVWLCAECSKKIAAGRRIELAEAVIEADVQGMAVALITYTFPHRRSDDLRQLVDKFAKAKSKLRACRAWKRFVERWGIAGEVKASEVTHSERNGWHPHAHNLTFFHAPISEDRREEFESDLYDAWKAVCIRADLPTPSREHGVHVLWYDLGKGSTAKVAADYVAGWAAIQELTGAPSKAGRRSGRSQWALLEDASRGDARAGELWLEYAAVFHGRQQLRWSKGLRNQLKKQELFDSDLLDEGLAEARLVVTLSRDQWGVICRGRSQEWILCVVEQEGGEAVRGAINSVLASIPMPGGRMVEQLE